jgi:hypothetical protein
MVWRTLCPPRTRPSLSWLCLVPRNLAEQGSFCHISRVVAPLPTPGSGHEPRLCAALSQRTRCEVEFGHNRDFFAFSAIKQPGRRHLPGAASNSISNISRLIAKKGRFLLFGRTGLFKRQNSAFKQSYQVSECAITGDLAPPLFGVLGVSLTPQIGALGSPEIVPPLLLPVERDRPVEELR